MELKFDNDEYKAEENKASCIVYVDDVDLPIYEREFTYIEALEKVRDRLVNLIKEAKTTIDEIDEEIINRQ